MIHNQAAFGGDCSPLSVRIIKSVDDCLHEFKKAIVSGNYVTREISKSHQIKKFTKTAETDLLTVRTGLLHTIKIIYFIPNIRLMFLFEVKFKSEPVQEPEISIIFKLSCDS